MTKPYKAVKKAICSIKCELTVAISTTILELEHFKLSAWIFPEVHVVESPNITTHRSYSISSYYFGQQSSYKSKALWLMKCKSSTVGIKTRDN
jgi:hypothetical protein